MRRRAPAPPRPVRRLLVSIHDATPALWEPVRRLWDRCAALGVRPALLVVPDWHGRWPLDRHPAFVDWVRERAGEGAEIFLHGERHDEVGLRRRVRDLPRAWGRTAREGEFLSLDRAAAGERIARGLDLLDRLGLRPVGFVPPAWLARDATWAAAAAHGLPVAEDAGVIRLLASGRRLRSPVIRWSARTGARARASALVAAARTGLHRRDPLVRIALHPGDLASPVTAASLERTLARLVAARRVVPYLSLLPGGDGRPAGHEPASPGSRPDHALAPERPEGELTPIAAGHDEPVRTARLQHGEASA